MHALFLAVLITVSGQGHASAPPDSADESFTIATDAQSAEQAVSDNNARYTALLARLKSLNIANSQVRTTSYNLRYSRPPAVQPDATAVPVRERYGYFVNRSVDVWLQDLTLTGKAIDAAVGAGVTDVGGVSYGVRQARGLFARAVASAVADARMQAEAMAAAAGLHIVRIRSMQQSSTPLSFPVPMMRQTLSAAIIPPTQIEPNAVEATADVTVVYEAVPKL